MIAEYFNREPIGITYRNEEELLWKMDFGKEFARASQFRVIDYGFLWGEEFDSCGFDDVTYWIFKRDRDA